MNNFDVDFLHGMLLSIESDNGYTEESVNQAVVDWNDFYEGTTDDRFIEDLCNLITEADKDQLFRISRGFPSHVKVFCEETLAAMLGENNGQK